MSLERTLFILPPLHSLDFAYVIKTAKNNALFDICSGVLSAEQLQKIQKVAHEVETETLEKQREESSEASGVFEEVFGEIFSKLDETLTKRVEKHYDKLDARSDDIKET